MEEEPPGTDDDAPTARAAEAEGAAQGERNLQWDLARTASKRRWVLGAAVAALACWVGVGVGIAIASPPLVVLFFPGLILLILVAALFGSTRAFQSDMVWVVYDGTIAGSNVRFRVKSAHVLSANLRTRHSSTRSVARFVADPALQQDARTLADELGRVGSGEVPLTGARPSG